MQINVRNVGVAKEGVVVVGNKNIYLEVEIIIAQNKVNLRCERNKRFWTFLLLGGRGAELRHASDCKWRRRWVVRCLTGNLLLFAELAPWSFLLLLQGLVSVRQQVFVGFVRQRNVHAVVVHGPGHVHRLWHLWGVRQENKNKCRAFIIIIIIFCSFLSKTRAGVTWCNTAIYWSNTAVLSFKKF